MATTDTTQMHTPVKRHAFMRLRSRRLDTAGAQTVGVERASHACVLQDFLPHQYALVRDSGVDKAQAVLTLVDAPPHLEDVEALQTTGGVAHRQEGAN